MNRLYLTIPSIPDNISRIESFVERVIEEFQLPENLGKTTGRGLFLMMKLTDGLLFARNGAKVVMTYSIINSSKI